METVGRLLEGVPGGGRVLDLASGTGRLSHYLQGQGGRRRRYGVVALDYSWPMIQRTRDTLEHRSNRGSGAVRGDAFALPFAAGTFYGIAALRFAFHWRDLAPLLREMRRVAAPGAPLVLDTYVWTPRALLALGTARWGGRVFTHHPARVRTTAARLGLTVEAEEHAFLCSPYVYRLLPMPVMRALERCERVVPPAWLCRVFWRLRTPERTTDQ